MSDGFLHEVEILGILLEAPYPFVSCNGREKASGNVWTEKASGKSIEIKREFYLNLGLILKLFLLDDVSSYGACVDDYGPSTSAKQWVMVSFVGAVGTNLALSSSATSANAARCTLCVSVPDYCAYQTPKTLVAAF